MLETEWKSGLVWVSRPLNMYLAIWAKFGPLRAKISKTAWETYPEKITMNCIHKKLLRNSPSFVGGVFLIFGLGWILPEPTVKEEEEIFDSHRNCKFSLKTKGIPTKSSEEENL